MGVVFRGQVTRSIPVEESSQVGQVRREALGLASAAGFGEIDGGRVALVATEVATNVLRHGQGGQVLLSLVQGRSGLGVEVCGIDRGPGFSLSRCLPDGYSTAGSPGQGLGAIQRQSQVFEVWSDARGAVVVSRIYAGDAPGNDLGYGALRIPMRRQAVCGDAWLLGWDGPQLVAVLIDGLGHGLQACEAAEEGLAAVADAPGLAADQLLARMHVCMSRTRGGAAAVFRHDSDSGQAWFAGAGNIAGAVHGSGGSSRGLASHPGIVGGQYRRAPAFSMPAAAGNLLVMQIEGLQSRWTLGQYEGLAHRHPALVVTVLLRDFDRGRDDVSLIAIRLGGRT